jgi:tetratricopeptide (TPR) repeat protein
VEAGAVKEAIRQYRDGEIIFREGEDSLAAFRLTRGRVRLVKAGAAGPLVLATLGKGEMFGEMGIVDGVPRSAAAIAEGAVTATVIPRNEFLDRLQKDPELAFAVMTKLVQRLRAADERLAHAAPPDSLPQTVAADGEEPSEPSPPRAAPAAAAPSPRGGLFARLFGRGKGGEAREPEAPVSGPPKLLVARFGDDLPPETAAILDTVVAALQGIPGATVRRIDEAPAWPEGVKDLEAARRSAAAAAAAMAASRGADAVIWGRMESIGRLLEIRVSAAGTPHELRLGRMSSAAGAFVPLEAFVEPLPGLIRAMTLAAILAEGPRRGADLFACLADDVLASAEGVRRAVSGMAAAEQAAALLAWASAAALVAGGEGVPDELWDQAGQAFEDAAKRLPRSARFDWADAFIGRGLLECARAERGAAPLADPAAPPAPGAKPATPWDAPAETLRLAMEDVRREDRPWDWALLHEKMGLIDYRRGLVSGDAEFLKTALNHYQAAIQVYTRAEFPQKWAEVISALAQALQVYGDQLASIPALERAVELCRVSLEERTEEEQPLLWAASQNNLGSALFLLAKRRDSVELFQAAAEAFRGALAVYQINNQGRLAAIAEKNLARAEDACTSRERRDQRLARPDWAAGAPREGDA